MQAQVNSVLDTFEAPDCSFLTIDRTEEIGAASVIDIAHESLIAHWKRLDAWVKEESESADWYKRLVRAAELHARGQAGLWSDPDLLWAWTRRNYRWLEPGLGRAIRFRVPSGHRVLGRKQARPGGAGTGGDGNAPNSNCAMPSGRPKPSGAPSETTCCWR